MSRFSAEEQHAIKKILQDNLVLDNINDQNKAAHNFSAANLLNCQKIITFCKLLQRIES
jgi:hypothetical protein